MPCCVVRHVRPGGLVEFSAEPDIAEGSGRVDGRDGWRSLGLDPSSGFGVIGRRAAPAHDNDVRNTRCSPLRRTDTSSADGSITALRRQPRTVRRARRPGSGGPPVELVVAPGTAFGNGPPGQPDGPVELDTLFSYALGPAVALFLFLSAGSISSSRRRGAVIATAANCTRSATGSGGSSTRCRRPA